MKKSLPLAGTKLKLGHKSQPGAKRPLSSGNVPSSRKSVSDTALQETSGKTNRQQLKGERNHESPRGNHTLLFKNPTLFFFPFFPV